MYIRYAYERDQTYTIYKNFHSRNIFFHLTTKRELFRKSKIMMEISGNNFCFNIVIVLESIKSKPLLTLYCLMITKRSHILKQICVSFLLPPGSKGLSERAAVNLQVNGCLNWQEDS